FNIEQLTIQGEEFTVLDVAGTWSTRSLWRQFAQGAAGIICVIDSADEAQIEETKEWLWRMYGDDAYRDTTLLVFANKQDRLSALSVKEVKDKLELETRTRGRPSGSGKTSPLCRLYLNESVTTITTYGFNLETVTIDGMELTLWDIGGICATTHPGSIKHQEQSALSA
ncbi:hypothetical protein BGW39_004644, partial [Mortierella sp. 14UC]